MPKESKAVPMLLDKTRHKSVEKKKKKILTIRNKLNYLFYSLDNSILKDVQSNPYLDLKAHGQWVIPIPD